MIPGYIVCPKCNGDKSLIKFKHVIDKKSEYKDCDYCQNQGKVERNEKNLSLYYDKLHI